MSISTLVSTSTTAMSPGDDAGGTPAARARIFSAMFMPMAGSGVAVDAAILPCRSTAAKRGSGAGGARLLRR